MTFRRWLFPIIAFCWPFLFYIELVLPINGHYFTIGNDFTFVYYPYKAYLLSALNQDYFPLWSPSESAGFAFYSNPFTQAFYPFNLPLLLWYKVFGGYTALDHQRFTILGVAIFALGLYIWLSQMRFQRRAILFAVLVMTISFKLADILRFTNAVHTVAWMPWGLYLLTRLIHEPQPRHAILLAVSLFFVLLCMFTAGYPYYVYYTPFLFGPYLLILLIPKLRAAFIGDQPVYLKRALTLSITAGVIALTLVVPYFVKMLGLMSQTADRAGGDFEYATEGPYSVFTPVDSIGSLIFPPASMTEGWLYFSILGLLLVAIYLASRGKAWYHAPIVKIGFLCWIAFIVYITYGKESLLFRFLWEVVPGFSTFRAWPRLNIVLVFVLTWMLAISYQHYETLITNAIQHKWKILSFLAGCAFIILITQLYFYVNHAYDDYWFQWHLGSANELAFIVFTPIALITLLLFIIGARPRRQTAPVFVMFVMIAAIDLKGGNLAYWVWRNGLAPTVPRTQYDLQAINMRSFEALRRDAQELNLMATLDENFAVNTMLNWYFHRYNEFLSRTVSEIPARHELLGVTTPGKLFFTGNIEYERIADFLDDRIPFEHEVVTYTGDELVLNVRVPADGYLSFIDNWDPDWTASVNGAATPIELLFGTFKSVRLPQGEHSVVFAYRPSLFRNSDG